jgi:hypothetical protein
MRGKGVVSGQEQDDQLARRKIRRDEQPAKPISEIRSALTTPQLAIGDRCRPDSGQQNRPDSAWRRSFDLLESGLYLESHMLGGEGASDRGFLQPGHAFQPSIVTRLGHDLTGFPG